MAGERDPARFFKTAWFAKAARKARVTDRELYLAIREAMIGQADDLGGGVFKKRLDKNRRRGIILAKGGWYWVYEYIFAKKDRDNIDDEELAAFRKLARAYSELSEPRLSLLLENKDLLEICHGDQN